LGVVLAAVVIITGCFSYYQVTNEFVQHFSTAMYSVCN
jgi:hypothetical protein